MQGAISLIARIHRSKNQVTEMGMAPLTITPSETQAKFLPSGLMTLCSTGLEGLVPKGGIFPSGDTTIPLNCKFRLLPDHFGLLMPLNQ